MKEGGKREKESERTTLNQLLLEVRRDHLRAKKGRKDKVERNGMIRNRCLLMRREKENLLFRDAGQSLKLMTSEANKESSSSSDASQHLARIY